VFFAFLVHDKAISLYPNRFFASGFGTSLIFNQMKAGDSRGGHRTPSSSKPGSDENKGAPQMACDALRPSPRPSNVVKYAAVAEGPYWAP
jgi:hypothetical protein